MAYMTLYNADSIISIPILKVGARTYSLRGHNPYVYMYVVRRQIRGKQAHE